jgi:hypothetical protein
VMTLPFPQPRQPRRTFSWRPAGLTAGQEPSEGRPRSRLSESRAAKRSRVAGQDEAGVQAVDVLGGGGAGRAGQPLVAGLQGIAGMEGPGVGGARRRRTMPGPSVSSPAGSARFAASRVDGRRGCLTAPFPPSPSEPDWIR